MWIGFFSTVVSSVLPGPGETKVSKKCMEPTILGVLAVNWM